MMKVNTGVQNPEILRTTYMDYMVNEGSVLDAPSTDCACVKIS